MEKVTLSDTYFSDLGLRGNIFINHTQEHVGTYEFFVNDESFLAAINIFSDFQRNGIGFFVFKSGFDKLNRNNRLKYFIASWSCHDEYSHLPDGRSVNLEMFLYWVTKGVSETQALWKTPSGKWLKRIGFTTAIVTKKNVENVTAVFTRDT